MPGWTHHGLRRLIDGPRIERAIAAAERRTSAQIRVSLAPFFWGNVERAAGQAFHRLGMTATPRRNAVLLFLVPARRQVVVRGDEGIDHQVGAPFWRAFAADVAQRCGRDGLTEAVIAAVAALGDVLAGAFPPDPEAGQGLPDTVDLGR